MGTEMEVLSPMQGGSGSCIPRYSRNAVNTVVLRGLRIFYATWGECWNASKGKYDVRVVGMARAPHLSLGLLYPSMSSCSIPTFSTAPLAWWPVTSYPTQSRTSKSTDIQKIKLENRPNERRNGHKTFYSIESFLEVDVHGNAEVTIIRNLRFFMLLALLYIHLDSLSLLPFLYLVSSYQE